MTAFKCKLKKSKDETSPKKQKVKRQETTQNLVSIQNSD